MSILLGIWGLLLIFWCGVSLVFAYFRFGLDGCFRLLLSGEDVFKDNDDKGDKDDKKRPISIRKLFMGLVFGVIFLVLAMQ